MSCLAARAFISSGQREVERSIVREVADLLHREFGIDSYVAIEVQGLHDVMRITNELSACDYFIFIDFKRDIDERNRNEISIFSHQELALAYQLRFKKFICFRQKGLQPEGFLRYLQANPMEFDSRDELLGKLRDRVRELGWSASYSRNLMVEQIGFSEPFHYNDHATPGGMWNRVWKVRVHNYRSDIAARNAVAMLISLTGPDGVKRDSPDRTYLKWAGRLTTYSTTILPETFGELDVFASVLGRPGLFLHSDNDVIPRQAVAIEDGVYRLEYRIYADGFQPIPLNVTANIVATDGRVVNYFRVEWPDRTTAQIEE